MKTLTIQSLKDQFASEENVFFVSASGVLQQALDIKFDNNAELSDWVNENLDSDGFDVDADQFTDAVNDIIQAVSEFYNLD